MQIEIKEIEGVTYFLTEARGVEYTIFESQGQWAVISRRKALGPMNPGSFRFFNNLGEFEREVKAMRGISTLLNPAVEMAQA